MLLDNFQIHTHAPTPKQDLKKASPKHTQQRNKGTSTPFLVNQQLHDGIANSHTEEDDEK